ncbi:uncharacterized protein K460DRAFT_363309 [Cucurbitaria berberidis CBS 394.84]|uniref:Uncharacterized protein n=1 Tax=Cucurbitaria berberidis CBS 394.84 TaxID=1168544 RepID=A0A9P4GKB0_9PLEO|nr:uncharacterized protein K460DRAFT_363309 [Cucurbitaria berberidis CBS 394.84]KAF1847202.1 hypothetical protein K460DRAFT_363309 [Cucurbitaria berberidis CBS 394.84]
MTFAQASNSNGSEHITANITVPCICQNTPSPHNLPAFLRLPRELRDLIYEHYVRVDGGYAYQFRTNKLTQSDGKPILLSLALASRQVASEMSGVALRTNTITFSAHFSETTREKAGLFHEAILQITKRKATLLNELAHRLLTSDMVEVAATSYPQFSSILDYWRVRGRNPTFTRTDCGEALSIWNDFIHFTLDLVSKHPKFVDHANIPAPVLYHYHGTQALDIKDTSLKPWNLVDSVELERLAIVAQVEEKQHWYNDNIRYSYSAASTALRFLHSVPKATRAAIRKIVLLEDRQSVAKPACHGRGFIPFCRENRNLRVERFVSLWKNAFPISQLRTPLYMIATPLFLESGTLDDDRLPANRTTKAVGTWVAEALALPSLGMPENSFTLVLDGNPTPEHTSEVFRVVQRDVAWQLALDTCYTRGLLPTPSWLDRRLGVGYMYEGLPDAVRNLSLNGSLIRCNFDPGSPYDVDSLLEEHRGWSAQDWEEGWATHEPSDFQTVPPLPPWHVLRWQNVII